MSPDKILRLCPRGCSTTHMHDECRVYTKVHVNRIVTYFLHAGMGTSEGMSWMERTVTRRPLGLWTHSNANCMHIPHQSREILRDQSHSTKG